MLFKLLIFASAVSAISCFTECGSPAVPPNEMSTHIVGGEPAVKHSWPWMVQVLRNGGHWCGGTLISDSWIVSAAHCFGSLTNPEEFEFSVGGHVINATNTEPTRQTKKALDIIRHEGYRVLNMTNDIALIRVDPFEINGESVLTACLTDKPTEAGKTAFVTGWGDQEISNPDIHLQQVRVPIVSDQDCSSAYPGGIDDTMICAGYPEGGKDACQGDSGGPMVVKNENGQWELVGIVSWGEGCAEIDKYGVYAEASHFYEWINDKMASYP